MHHTETNEWRAVCDKVWSSGFDSLSHAERVWVVTRELMDATDNGGLISYFYNSGADHLQACLEALDERGAGAVKEQVLKQCRLFRSKVPSTVGGRNAIISSWNGSVDAEIDEINDAVMPLLGDLIRGWNSS